MFQDGNKNIASVRNNILKCMTVANERMTVGKKNEAIKQSHETELAKNHVEQAELKELADHLMDLYKNIEAYSRLHQEKTKGILDLAIMKAGELVPDADVEGIHLKYTENNKCYVVNKDGNDINDREGSGYRAILGALMRYACLKAQPDALQLMVFDESFPYLSDTTTSLMKDVLEEMKTDISIVVVEQRHNVVDGITDGEYLFEKGADKITRVSKII